MTPREASLDWVARTLRAEHIPNAESLAEYLVTSAELCRVLIDDDFIVAIRQMCDQARQQQEATERQRRRHTRCRNLGRERRRRAQADRS